MRIKPEANHEDVKDLTPLEQKTRKAAIILAFIGVFCWAVKILFL